MKSNKVNGCAFRLVRLSLVVLIAGCSQVAFSLEEEGEYSPPECSVSYYDSSKLDQYKQPIGALFTKERYDSGVFRVFYTTSENERHAINEVVDSNGNGTPDYVEDVAIQAEIAREIFNALGFQDPLESNLFGAANHINIQIYDLGGNGLAYQDAWRYQNIPWMTNDCGLQLRISNSFTDVSSQSIVAHELFHLYQYGYSRFRIPWFEGNARWAEGVVRDDDPYRGDDKYLSPRLPGSEEELISNVFCKKYSAVNVFFGRVSEIMDESGGKMLLPESGMALATNEHGAVYSNGTPVVKNDVIFGASFVQELLRRMGEESDALSEKSGRDPYEWIKSDEESSENYWVAMSIVQDILRESGAKDRAESEGDDDLVSEIEAFLSIQPFSFDKETECQS